MSNTSTDHPATTEMTTTTQAAALVLRHPDRAYRNFVHTKPKVFDALRRVVFNDSPTEQDRITAQLWVSIVAGKGKTTEAEA